MAKGFELSDLKVPIIAGIAGLLLVLLEDSEVIYQIAPGGSIQIFGVVFGIGAIIGFIIDKIWKE